MVEIRAACEELKLSVSEAMGTIAWGPWLKPVGAQWGLRLWAQDRAFRAVHVSGIEPDAGSTPGVELGDRKELPKRSAPVEVRWKRGVEAGELEDSRRSRGVRVGGQAAFGAVPREHTCVASRERERAQGELQGSSDFQVGVDLRVTWAAEQRKRTKF